MPTDNVDQGLAANRPDPSPGNRDKFWYSVDTLELSVSDGDQWRVAGSGASSGSVIVVEHGAVDVLPSGTVAAANGSNTNLFESGSPLDVAITNPSDSNSMRVSALGVSQGIQLGAFDAGDIGVDVPFAYSRTTRLLHVESGFVDTNDLNQGHGYSLFGESPPELFRITSPTVLFTVDLTPLETATFRMTDTVRVDFNPALIDHVNIVAPFGAAQAQARLVVQGVVI